MIKVIDLLNNGLIVSCQALNGNPFRDSKYIAVMAHATALGGAVAIRANGAEDIQAIKNVVTLPVIGINKTTQSVDEVYITPTFNKAKEIAAVGADIIAIDGTNRKRPEGETLKNLIQRIQDELQLPVMADVSTFDEGVRAWKSGANIVATTLSGYTPYSPKLELPDFELVKSLAAKLSIPVIAEGRISCPEHLSEVFRLGAYAAVIGKMITNPMFITRKFVNIIKKK